MPAESSPYPEYLHPLTPTGSAAELLVGRYGLGYDDQQPQPFPIETADQWERKRQMLARIILDTLGQGAQVVPPLDLEVLEEHDHDAYLRQKVVYQVEEGEHMPAWLLIPKGITQPRPGVVAFRGTGDPGKDYVAGLIGPPERQYGRGLAERGYVVLCPDVVSFGERVSPGFKAGDTDGLYQRHPDWSAMGKMLWDGRRAIDLLAGLDYVKADRIGVIGNSLGSQQAVFQGVFDERVKVVVASCGFVLLSIHHNPFVWCRDRWFNYIPKLRWYLECGKPTPFDWHELFALLAPKPFFCVTSRQDEPVQPASQEVACDLAAQVYRLLGAAERIVNFTHPDPHGFNSQALALAYEWMDRWL